MAPDFASLASNVHRADRKYPWRLWMNGDSHQATYSPVVRENSEGKWFFAKPESFVVMLRTRGGKAKRVELVSGVNDDDVPTVVFRFYSPDAQEMDSTYTQ